MQFANRIKQVSPSATLTINAKAAELRSQGRDVISLAAGEPDFSPPEHVLQAAKLAIQDKHTKYTPVSGMPELLSAISGYFFDYYGYKPENNMITTTNGGKQGLFNLLQILLNPGEEALIPAPYWVSYPEMVKLASGNPVMVPTEPESNFKVGPQLLQNYITSRTKVLIINTPCNPTGCHYSQQEMDEIVEWALNKDLFVISDEIYDQLVYHPAQRTSVISWLWSCPQNLAIVNGLSKSFAMTGWRAGFVLAAPEVIGNLNKLQGQSTSNICSVTQHAALAALRDPGDFMEKSQELFVRRRNKALDIVNKWEGVTCPKPEGAFYLFPRISHYYYKDIQDSTAMCTYLLENAGVALVPGVAFGDDSCLRISYALEENKLLSALQKVQEVLEGLT